MHGLTPLLSDVALPPVLDDGGRRQGVLHVADAVSDVDDVWWLCTDNMSRVIERNDDECSRRIDAVESLVTAAAASISRCRVCFRETEGSSQCKGHRNTCSDWSNLSEPSWTKEFRDDTDNRYGGCTYQWRVECM